MHWVASQTLFLKAPVGQASKHRRQSAQCWDIGYWVLDIGTGLLMRISPGCTILPKVGWMSWWFLPINPSPASTHQRRSSIGAESQMDQAQADKNIAQARAEERRAMAIALEQEMKAKAQEARAKVIEAEAEVPIAMAEAFRNGNLGIMDYYRMENIQADTEMRDSIAKPQSGSGNKK